MKEYNSRPSAPPSVTDEDHVTLSGAKNLAIRWLERRSAASEPRHSEHSEESGYQMAGAP